MKKILITGTHFTPAQAVIEELKEYPDIEIYYIGRKTTFEGDKTVSQESKILPSLGVKFMPLIAGRFRRDFSIYTIISWLKIPVGFVQAFYQLLVINPDVILSFGGYVAFPVVFWGSLLSIPIIIHEQTLVSGLSNRLSFNFASKIALSFKDHPDAKNKKVVITGNPIRKELFSPTNNLSSDFKKILEEKEKTKLPLIFITGGNQGAHIINENIGKIIHKLNEKYIVVHQTGDSKFNDFENLNKIKNDLKKPERYHIFKWIDVNDLAHLYPKTDLVISRAGINTLLELSLFKIPAIIIPIPFIFKNEQVKNANYFKEKMDFEVVLQNQLNPQLLLKKISEMINKKSSLKKGDDLVIADAAQKLALQTLILLHETKV